MLDFGGIVAQLGEHDRRIEAVEQAQERQAAAQDALAKQVRAMADRADVRFDSLRDDIRGLTRYALDATSPAVTKVLIAFVGVCGASLIAAVGWLLLGR